MGVSVIIPCRNQAATLERAVKSAFAAGADEVLVFDDASTDNTWDILCDNGDVNVFANHSDIRMGVSVVRNIMIEDASHDWIIPLDADDELLRIPDVTPKGWAYGGWIEHYEDGTEQTFAAPPYKMITRKPLCHATMLFNKHIWLASGGYDPDFFYGEDYGIQCALMNIDPPVHLDYPLYRRYVGSNARTDKAMKYWPIIQEMAKEKYPAVFS